MWSDQYHSVSVAAHLLTQKFPLLPKDVLFKLCQGFLELLPKFCEVSAVGFIDWDGLLKINRTGEV